MIIIHQITPSSHSPLAHERRETIAASGELVGQLLVVNAEQSHDRGVEVMHMHAVLREIVAEFIRLTIHGAFRNPSPGNPSGETAGMMVAPKIGADFPLTVVGTPKFTAPHDKRVVQQTALFQIFDKTCGGLVYFFTGLGQSSRQATMMIPVRMIKLDEAHPASAMRRA